MTTTPPESFVETRRVGDATVTLINDGWGLSTIIQALEVPEEQWRRSVPEASSRGEVVFCYQVAHVALGDASVLIDVGFDDPSPSSPWREPRHHRSPGVVAGLAAIGVAPEQVTHVVLTHAHGDHVAGATVESGRPGQLAARFPRARHFIGRADRSAGGDLAQLNLGALERLGQLELVDGPSREIAPGVEMIHAPGESAGHSIVRVRSRGERFYFLGDLFHHPCEVLNPGWVSRGRDAAAMQRSRAQLLAEAADGATLAYTHSLFPGWGRVVRDGDEHRWIAG